MATKRPMGLGRGLDSVFFENAVDETGPAMLRLSDIEPNPNQPRKDFNPEALEELANSIAANGLINPIVVRSSKNEGYYQIIAGERRWRACKMAGLTQVPVVIMELDDKKTVEAALVENVIRENLNPIEEAKGYKYLIEEFDMTQEQVAENIGKKSRSAITNALRLLDLPEKTLDMVASGKISAGHGRALLGLKNKDKIDGLATLIAAKSLSVRDTEKLVKRENKEKKAVEKQIDSVDYCKILAEKMTKKLGNRVFVKPAPNGKSGKLEIAYMDGGELNELVTKLCGENIFDD